MHDGKKEPAKRANTKKESSRRIIGLSVFTMLFVATILTLIMSRNTDRLCDGDLNAKIYKDAAAAIKSQDVNTMQKVVSRIDKSLGYTSDTNCMYMVVSYYTFIQDSDSASHYLGILKKTYEKNPDLAEPYRDLGYKNIDNLVQQVKKLESGPSDFNSSKVYF